MVANMEYDELYKAVLRPGRKMETERQREKYHKSLLCFDVHVKDGGRAGHYYNQTAQDKRLVTTEWVEKCPSAYFIVLSPLTKHKTLIKKCQMCKNME